MLVDSQATSHFVLLLGIPERYRREEIISFLGDMVSLGSFKMLRHFDAQTQRHTKLGIVQVHSVFDISRTVSRYLGDHDGCMENLLLKGDLRIFEEVVGRPTNLKISFRAADEAAARATLATVLSGCGELSEVSTEYEEDLTVCSFQVASSFSMSSICTGQTFSAQGIQFHVEFEEESLGDSEFKELLQRAQLDMNHLQHYHQGLGLQTKDSLKRLSAFQNDFPFIKGIVEQLFESPRAGSADQTSEARAVWPEEDSDKLSALFEDEEADEFGDECPGSLQHASSPFTYFSAHNCEQFLEEKSFSSATGSAFKPRSSAGSEKGRPASPADPVDRAADLPTTALPQPAADCLGEGSVLVSVEDRIVELIGKLQSLGSKIDSGFFDTVYAKIDPSTENSEFLRAGLKILKTKIRKLRRKEKRRLSKKAAKGEPMAESSEDDDSEDMQAQASNRLAAQAVRTKADSEFSAPKQQVKVVTQPSGATSRLLVSSPREWVKFITNLTPIDGSPPAAKLKLVSAQNRALQTVVQPATVDPSPKHLLRNEHDMPWFEHLRSLRGRKQKKPEGWPDSVPQNLRLNRASPVRSRHSLQPRTTTPSPLHFSPTQPPHYFQYFVLHVTN